MMLERASELERERNDGCFGALEWQSRGSVALSFCRSPSLLGKVASPPIRRLEKIDFFNIFLLLLLSF